MAYKVIDISQWNGNIDWNKAKNEIDGAIIRAGYRGYGAAGTLATDTKFNENMSNAIAAGVPVGVYWLSQALSEAEAKAEAVYLVSLMKKYKVAYPVYLDSEHGEIHGNGRADKLDRGTRTKYAKAFLKALKDAGYTAGLYCSEWWYMNDIDGKSISDDGYTVWCANITNKPKISKYDAWQYTWKGKISGINGDVDVSYFYKKFGEKTTATAQKPAAKYFVKTTYTGVSLVEGLRSIGAQNTFAYRKQIAKANGILNYTGTAVQNTKLLDLLKKGKLIKP